LGIISAFAYGHSETKKKLCRGGRSQDLFGPKRDDVTGEWRNQHNEELNLYSSPNIIPLIKSRRMKWAGHIARLGARRDVYRVLVEKSERMRPVGRPRHRWEDNI